MRELIIKLLWGNVWNSAKYLIPLLLVVGACNLFVYKTILILTIQIVAVVLFLLIAFCSFIYLSIWPASYSELNEEQRKYFELIKKNK